MSPAPSTIENEFVVDFPVMWVSLDWIENHCVIPDGFNKGQPYILADWQAWYFQNFYRVKRNPPKISDQYPAIGAPAFYYRRAQVVMPQKAGKGPMTASHVCLEALGPALFAGWAKGGETYRCSYHGCPCGWVYVYEPGEPMGVPWPTPLIQITAFSEEQAGNVYDALKPMIDNGPLSEVVRTGQELIRLPGGGRIDTVTSSNQSRLGQRVTFVPQDEALSLDTPLPTPTGWTTMGAVRVGDELLGADGMPTRVVKATPVQFGRICYRVIFEDGTSIVASDGHRWLTRISGSAARPAVRSTGEMVADGRRFRIPAGAAFDLPEADLPVDPYFLGVWLGDGSTGKCEITSGDQDAAEMQRLLADVGVVSEIRHYGADRAPTLCFSSKSGFRGSSRPSVAKALRGMECFTRKHIPAVYLRASRGQREALLQGLMDSDGHITESGFCTFAGNETLANDVVNLLRSLGIRTRAVRRADERAKSGYGWKVNFTPRGNLRPFRIARKASRVRQAWTGSDWVSVTSIEVTESVPVRCIEVDSPGHLFLAGEASHVTHNTGIWLSQNKMDKVAATQRRGASGMQGRTAETTNAWDPAENSVAQKTAEAALQRPDIFRLHRQAPPGLRFTNREDRRRIFRIVYAGCHWVDLDAIEAECAEIMLTDPAQAQRFYGNRIVAGLGSYLDEGSWDVAARDTEVPPGTAVAVGFDGSDSDDWTALRCVTSDGFCFTPTYGEDNLPTFWNPAQFGGRVPRIEVDAAVDAVFSKYKVRRMYADPYDWESEIDSWVVKYGEEIVVPWATYRIIPMHSALVRFRTDLESGRATHDLDPVAKEHALRARKAAKPQDRFLLSKPHPHQKIDVLMATVLGYEAASDLTLVGGWKPAGRLTRVTGKARSY